MGAVALGLCACNSDEVPNSNKGGEEINSETYLSFSIAMPNDGTRAAAGNVSDANEGDTYIGTEEEQKVTDIRVVLYNEHSIVAYSFDFTENSQHGDGTKFIKSKSGSYYTTDAIKVKNQSYDALVLINPLDEVKNVTEPGMILEKFADQAVEISEDKLVTKKGIFMSNAKGLSTVPETAIKNTKKEAEDNPFKDGSNGIKVDRAVAKVFVGKSTTLSTSDNATVTLKGWTLDITNKKLFWMRKFDKYAAMKNTFYEEEKTTREERFQRYAKDPNFSNGIERNENEFNYITEIVNDVENRSTRFGVAEVSRVRMSIDPSEVVKKDFGFGDNNGLYLLENTMQADRQYQPVTTRVIVQAEYIPNQLFKESDEVQDKSWYDFDGIPIRADYLQKLYNNDAHEPSLDPDEHQMIANELEDILGRDRLDLLINIIEYFETETGNKFNQDLGPDGQSYIMYYDDSHKLSFYKNAICYYPIRIRHFSDDLSDKTNYQYAKTTPDHDGYGRYGVVRNNIYKLTINSVKKPGLPIIDYPNEKDDNDSYYLAIQSHMMPWLVRTQEVDL